MGVPFFYFSREFEFSELEKEPKKRLVTRQVLYLDMAVLGLKNYVANLDEKKSSHAKLSGRGWLKLCGRVIPEQSCTINTAGRGEQDATIKHQLASTGCYHQTLGPANRRNALVGVNKTIRGYPLEKKIDHCVAVPRVR